LVTQFAGQGEMAARMAALDWASTPLGPASKWPQSLRTAVGICLSSRYPMVIWWGPHLALLYNDAWVPILGPDKHPALGLPGMAVWPEHWHIIGQQLQSVLHTGQATFSDDQYLPVKRFGYLEEAYFTYSYSAIRDESGAVGGVFTAITETTQQVLGDRRLRTLRTLGERTTFAATQPGATTEDVFAAGLGALADDRADIPFAAIYMLNPGDPEAHLIGSMGMSDPSVLSAAVYGSTAGLVLRDIVNTGATTVLDAVPPAWGAAIKPGANLVGDLAPSTALILPIQSGGDDLPATVMVAGVSPYRSLDDDFRGFLDVAAAQIGRAIVNAQAYQAERLRSQRNATLSSFAAALSTTTSSNTLLTTAAAQLGEVFAAERVVVAQWHGQTADPVLVSWPDTAVDERRRGEALAALETARNRPAASITTAATEDDTVLVASPLGGGGSAAIVIELETPRDARPEDRALFDLLIRHLSQALATAREYEQTRAVALTLQHAILGPTRLPHGFAVRYTPAVEPFEVGGDWYDVITLDDDHIGIVVGDSVGRGLPAAAVMGQLRSAAQALLLRTPEPAKALADLDNFARRLPAASCTTVFCAVIDLSTSTVRYSSAGHPPPVLVDRTGAQIFDRAQSVPLAATESVWARPEAEVRLLPGATLLLYTDGLIERRGESLDVGIGRASEALNRYRHSHPDYVADQLMTDMAPPSGFDDDVAVLLYRHPPSSLTVRSPARPTSLAPIRERLRRWLPAAAINAETAEDVVLAVGEAAANAAEHARKNATHQVELTVTARLTKAGLALTVSDDGHWQEPSASEANRGHGIALMHALVDAVKITSTGQGTTVDMLKDLHS
jgi:serine phosphatase RsbU (regulator of sigma subunit)/anti-sigma regulatory factor (Ser/Thr protein kinase)